MSIREELDEATGISSRVLTDWRQQPKAATLKPRITLTDEKHKVVKLPTGLRRITTCLSARF